MIEPLETDQMHTAAVAMHEMFRCYVLAGFTEPQAVELVVEHIRVALKPPGSA